MDRDTFEGAMQHAAAQLLVAAQTQPDGLSDDMKALAAELQVVSVEASERVG